MSDTTTATKKPVGRPKGSATKAAPKSRVNGHMIGVTPMEERQLRVRAEYIAKLMSDHIGFDVTPAQACMHGLHLAEQLHDHD